jgi:hypothetical protein
VLTFLCVVFAWVFFRAQSFATARAMLEAMFLGNGLSLPGFLAGRLGHGGGWLGALHPQFDGPFHNALFDPVPAVRWVVILALIAWLAPNTQELMARYRPVLGFPRALPEGRRFGRLHWRPSYAWSVAIALLSAFAIMNMWIGTSAEFLYFQF